jgi:hypothetical protein
LAYTTDILQIPDEAVAVLVQAVALRIMQGQAQPEQYAMTKDLLDRNIQSLKNALTPRNERSSIKIRPGYSCFGSTRRIF